MINQNSGHTIVVLANANALVAAIAQEVLGDDVADSIAGSTLSTDAIYSLTQARLQQKLNTYRGKI